MAAATKITRTELLRLNGLISKVASLRRAVPPSTRSAWLHLKRRPTRAKVRRLLLQAGVNPSRLVTAPSKMALSVVPDRLHQAWHLCLLLSRATNTVWDVHGSSAAGGVWTVQSSACHVAIGDVMSLAWRNKPVLHTDSAGVIVRHVADLFRQGAKAKQRKSILSIKDLHARHQKLHKAR